MTPGRWSEWLDCGRYAPSGHNTQPWLVEPLSETEADLYYVPRRLLPVEDPLGRFTASFLGVFVEALNVAAAADGTSVSLVEAPAAIDMTPGDEPRLYGRLRTGDAPTTTLERSLLVTRRTSRLPFDGRTAPAAAADELVATAAEFGHVARLFDDPDTVRWVVGLNADTVFYDLEEDDRRDEIGLWTHFTNGDAERAGDGFSPRCLGFPGPLLRLFFRHHRVLRGSAQRSALRRLYLRSMHGTAHVGYLKAVWQTQQQCFDSGRLLLRIWLGLTQRGLVLHPFGSVVTNARSHAELLERLGDGEGDDEIWLLFRLGYSADPPAAARLEREALLR